jgi:hypothetical protein
MSGMRVARLGLMSNATDRIILIAAAALICLGWAGRANAILFTVQEANQAGVTFEATPTHPGFNVAGAITATFDYTGALNFANSQPQNFNSSGDLNSNFFVAANIAGYSGSGALSAPANANFNTLADFLASSGSAGNYQYGSFYTIDLGVLAAGTSLTITHDDGASIFQGGSQIGTMTTGPTTQVTESVTLPSTADTTLYYVRENGSPSVLTVAINGVQLVAEPGSLTLIGSALVGFGLFRRRSVTKTKAGGPTARS